MHRNFCYPAILPSDSCQTVLVTLTPLENILVAKLWCRVIVFSGLYLTAILNLYRYAPISTEVLFQKSWWIPESMDMRGPSHFLEVRRAKFPLPLEAFWGLQRLLATACWSPGSEWSPGLRMPEKAKTKTLSSGFTIKLEMVGVFFGIVVFLPFWQFWDPQQPLIAQHSFCGPPEGWCRDLQILLVVKWKHNMGLANLGRGVYCDLRYLENKRATFLHSKERNLANILQYIERSNVSCAL